MYTDTYTCGTTHELFVLIVAERAAASYAACDCGDRGYGVVVTIAQRFNAICICVCVCVCVCVYDVYARSQPHAHMCVCEMKKKGKGKKRLKFFRLPPPGTPRPLPSIRSRDDIKHLQTLNTFRHPSPSDTQHLQTPTIINTWACRGVPPAPWTHTCT